MVQSLFVEFMMQRNAAVLTAICLLLCLSFNYTFPLHRANVQSFTDDNITKFCDPLVHRQSIIDRTKKMAANFEIALRRLKNSTQDIGKNIYEHLGMKTEKNPKTEEDLREFEQLVIMKKYPYLDLRELEEKFLTGKNVRESEKFEPGHSIDGYISLCEPLEDGPNVEIMNRGLSGFAIPPHLAKHSGMFETNLLGTKIKDVDSERKPADSENQISIETGHKILKSLKDDVEQYVEKKSKSNE